MGYFCFVDDLFLHFLKEYQKMKAVFCKTQKVDIIFTSYLFLPLCLSSKAFMMFLV